MPPERRRIGMVFQDGGLFPHRSVAQNVGYGVRRDDRALRTSEALRLVGLEAKAQRSPGTLSGGEQQRVALARALAPGPGAILLDEPFSSLDASLRTQLRDEVRALMKGLGVTGVLVTHDQREALAFGDRVGVMHDGRLEQIDTPTEVYARPASPWLAHFVGEATVLPAQLSGTSATTALGRHTVVAGRDGPGAVMFRPEQLAVVDGDRGRVRAVEYVGPSTRYEIDLAGGIVAVSTAFGPPARRVGDPVDLAVDDAAVHHAWPSSTSAGSV